ncbi:MAG: hypothetical protein KBS45_04620 [Clostridiales bacterium]|nr:hypothetical protein [Candidatus Coliplasma caballi]
MKMKKTMIRRSVMMLLVLCMTAMLAIPVSAKSSGAKLTIDGYKSREVIRYTYTFTTAVDAEGQLTGMPRGGMITVEVKALNDGNCDLLAWMLERNLPKKGQIDLVDPATGKIKTIQFKNAYCVDFKEGMTEDGIHTEIITITCGVLSNGDAVYENDWGGLTGSMLSEGNLWIVISVAVVVIGGVAALVIVKKKQKSAAADGAEKKDEE